ncbi:unnamed protein product [Dicrocoelium dendriticum]|nr:unnamed protein product [Dicrocoelium dendriticum]
MLSRDLFAQRYTMHTHTALTMLLLMATPGLSEIIPVGVRLNVSGDLETIRDKCDLLRQRASTVWDSKAVSTCNAKTPIVTDQEEYIVPYQISVDTSKLPDFPPTTYHFEKMAHINEYLNIEAVDCMTVTGSNWQVQPEFSSTTFQALIDYSPEGPDCEAVERRLNSTNVNFEISRCSAVPTEETSTEDSIHRLQLTVTTEVDDELPPSTKFFNTLTMISRVLNNYVDKCVHVWDVQDQVRGVNKDIYLRFVVRDPVAGQDGCSVLEKTLASHQISKNLTRCRQQPSFGVKRGAFLHYCILQAGDFIDGKRLSSMGAEEVAVYVQAAINARIPGCAALRPDSAALWPLKKQESYAAVVSGPRTENCTRLLASASYVYPKPKYTCSYEPRPLAQHMSLYRLLPKRPVLDIDILWHMNQHNKLINTLNSGYDNCEYNGYILFQQH